MDKNGDFSEYNECNNLILEIIKKEYKKRSSAILNMELHLEYLCSEHIISFNENSRYMKILNDILRVLNMFYSDIQKNPQINFNFVNNKSEKNILTFKNIKNAKKIGEIKHLENIIEFMDIMDIKEKNLNELYEIDSMMKEMTKTIGAKNLDEVIYIHTKRNHNSYNFNTIDKDLINILNDIFVPISVDFTTVNNDVCENKIMVNHLKTSRHDQLLDNYYCVNIFLKTHSGEKKIEIKGFFKMDCINLVSRTSQVYNEIILKKKEQFLKSKKNIIVPDDFRVYHVRNLCFGELVANTQDSYNQILVEDYELYQKYSGYTYKQLFDCFLQLNLEKKFKMIKILLFGHGYLLIKNSSEQVSNNYTNNAGLLYGLVKESKIGTSLVADIFLKNLNLVSRLKLAKSNTSIKHELEKLEKIDTEDVDFKKQLLANPNIPQKVRNLINIKINEIKTNSNEYYKQVTYVRTLLDFPWLNLNKNDNQNDIFNIYKNDKQKKKEIIISMRERLDSKVYGHKECKETISELIGKWFSNPDSMGKAIGLNGPPGVGKTLIAKELGKALNLPFSQINLGGLDDGCILSGHSITYSGAVPGLIIKSMVENGKSRCIIFFDELDKTAFKQGRNEITDTLIHLIDQTSNAEFMDKFFQEVKFPLNKVLFIFSFNDKSKIDKILLDRMEVINVGSYTISDKINIINNFILKDMKNEFNFNDVNIILDKEDAIYLIDSFTMEAGVRNIKRKIEKIFSKLNMNRLMEKGPFENDNKEKITEVKITQKLIDEYIENLKVQNKCITNTPKIGNVNGLYATDNNYGGIIPILIYKNHGNKEFKLELTGKQGDVMKESVKFAFTIAMNILKSEYRKTFMAECSGGLHVHTPDGSTQKDGPSAGCAFTLGFISVMLGKKIKNNIGLTGEIEQDGNITAIGGLEQKLYGAKKSGINLVFVPKENEKDLAKIKNSDSKIFDKDFSVLEVSHISEVLDYALIEDKHHEYKKDEYNRKLFDHKNYIGEIFDEKSSPMAIKNR